MAHGRGLRLDRPPSPGGVREKPERQPLHQQARKQAENEMEHDVHDERCVKHEARLLVLTTIAKPMNRFSACGDPRAERGPRIER
jgi:hypothetical protein